MDRSEILNQLTAHRDVLHGMGVKKLGLFGSSVRSELNPSSDLDFVVEFEHKSFDIYMDLKFYLEDLFGRPVDLVTTDAIKPRLRETILSELVYATGF